MLNSIDFTDKDRRLINTLNSSWGLKSGEAVGYTLYIICKTIEELEERVLRLEMGSVKERL